MKRRPEVTTLPKWAQERIALLERNLAQAKADLIHPFLGSSGTAFLDDHIGAPIPLPGDSVVFKIAGDCELRCHVVQEIDGESYLDVNLSGRRGRHLLAVLPRAGNVVYIRGSER